MGHGRLSCDLHLLLAERRVEFSVAAVPYKEGGDAMSKNKVLVIGGGMGSGITSLIAACQEVEKTMLVTRNLGFQPLCGMPEPMRIHGRAITIPYHFDKPANNGPEYRIEQAERWSNKYNHKVKR